MTINTVYNVSRDTIISNALRKLQVLELGTTPDTDTLTNASQALNNMIKAWQSNGIKLWSVNTLTMPLVAGTSAYTVGPSGTGLATDKPLKITQAWMRNISVTPNIDTPLQVLSRQEYNILGSKNSSGMVNSIFYDVRNTYGIINLYLNPDTATATNYQLVFVAQVPMQDVPTDTSGGGSTLSDFPNEWLQALVWGLADELAIEYGLHINYRQEISAKANKYRTDLEDWDVETTSTMFTIDQRMNYK